MGKMAWKDAETLYICMKWKAWTICILHQSGAADWPFHHREPVPDLSKAHVLPGDRQVWGRQQQLGGLRHGLWVRVRVAGARRAQITWGTGSVTSGDTHDTAGTWLVFAGSLGRAHVQYPKQIHESTCAGRKQCGLGKACFSEKASVREPSISRPMSSCISCCSQLVSPGH